MKDQELITAIAKNVMGWTVLDKAIEHNDTGEIVFFWDTSTPIKATAYETNSMSRQCGGGNYRYAWERWNPLTDPTAMFDVINAIAAKGCRVTLGVFSDRTFCSINEGTIEGFSASDPTPGRALCRAAIQWAEARQIETDANAKMIDTLREFMSTRWPDGAQYAAIDANGNVFCYKHKPKVLRSCWGQIELGPILQTGWLAIEDGADWEKLIVDRPEEDKNFNTIREVLDQMLKLATDLAPECRWITCDWNGHVTAWTKKPTINDDNPQYDPATWHMNDLLSIGLGHISHLPSDIDASTLIIDRLPPTDSVSYAHQILA